MPPPNWGMFREVAPLGGPGAAAGGKQERLRSRAARRRGANRAKRDSDGVSVWRGLSRRLRSGLGRSQGICGAKTCRIPNSYQEVPRLPGGVHRGFALPWPWPRLPFETRTSQDVFGGNSAPQGAFGVEGVSILVRFRRKGDTSKGILSLLDRREID